MIFKTFQSDLDGISNKIGFSKRSFAEWGRQVSTSFKESEGVINRFKNTIQTMFTVQSENTNNWIRNKMGDIISKDNIDSLIPELTENATGKILNQIIAIDKANVSWHDYFKQLKNQGQGCIVDLIKNTDDLSKLTGEDLVKANQQARASAIAHNEAIKAQTLSAKAGSVALKALSIAGNMLAAWAITKGIELAVKGIDRLIHSAEYAEKAFKAATDSAKSFSQAVKDIQKDTVDMEKSVDSIINRYAELSQGVDSFTNENKSLSTDEYEEFLDLNKQLAGLFPSLTSIS